MKLTRERAVALGEKISPMVGYLVPLRERATKAGFTSADEFYQVVPKAEHRGRDLRRGVAVWLT